MPPQQSAVSMEAIGVRNYMPPTDVPSAPRLKDGIHLRWSFERDLGFPWHGFYLFRRRHEPGKFVCAEEIFRELQPGRLLTNRLATSIGEFSSERNLTLTDIFPPSGKVEFDLRQGLRFDPSEPVRGVELTIGLRSGNAGETCIDFRERSGRFPNPLEIQGVKFEVFDFQGNPETVLRVDAFDQLYGLIAGFRTSIDLTCAATSASLLLSNFASPSIVYALDAAGNVIDRVETTRRNEPEQVILTGDGIAQLVIESPQNELLIHQVCFSCPGEGQGEEGLRVTALSNEVPVDVATAGGTTGAIVTLRLAADRIDSVVIDPSEAALIDICVIPITQNIRQGWNPVPGLKQPVALPVGHPDYPCPGAPSDFNEAKTLANERVRYELPVDWQKPESFEEIHTQLVELVRGGPSGGSMAERSVSIPVENASSEETSFQLINQHPLDLVLLASLYPALAQMTGLYWVDSEVQPEQAYDYLLVADYDRRFDGNTEDVRRWITSNGFVGIEAYAVFNKRLGDAPSLNLPQDARSYALPGGVFPDREGVLRDSQNTAGIRWRIEHITVADGQIRLLPNQPIMYHVWRADLGLDNPPAAAPAREHRRITDSPMLVTDSLASSLPERASDWPPFPLFAQDRGLADGWYSYRVNGIDIFGRYSSLSDSARWYQWSPVPNPAPWYYRFPEDDRVIYPFAIQLLDKLPPPPPTGVEAQALDPEDPYLLRDTTYNTWFDGLSPTEKESLIGLRVRWLWTPEQQRQAPDTLEFRIYFNPGSAPPSPDSRVTINWQDRIYIVGFNEQVRVESGIRMYEILLPAQGDAVRDGLPLNPTLANPVAYANIGVTAVDDKTHTGDHVKWDSGNWGGRTGNESVMSLPATIYRVRRVRPEPPVPPPDSDKVFATPANYHDHSFYTYRWRPQPHLKTHIFRALDDTVFQTDWTARPHTIAANDEALFPIELRGNNPGIVARREEIAAELNGINDFPRSAAGKQDAIVYYRSLSNDGLRVLASLLQTARAFTQITTTPLDPNEAANNDRRGPDSPANYTPDVNLRAYMDTLDGRAMNRYFYRSAYVDGANNISNLSNSSPPVYLPNITPPNQPHLLKALGSDRSIRLIWGIQKDRGIQRFLIYRTDNKQNSHDIRLMGPPVADLPALPLIPDGGVVDLGTNIDVILVERVYEATTFDPGRDLLNGQSSTQFLATPTAPVSGTISGITAPDGTRVVVVYRDSKSELQYTAVPNQRLAWVDAGLRGPRTYYYRLVAISQGETGRGSIILRSEPSVIGCARAVDLSPPEPPQITTIEWVRVGDNGTLHPYSESIPIGEERYSAVRLKWSSPDSNLRCMVQLRTASEASFRNASRWLPRGIYEYVHPNEFNFEEQTYRIKVLNEAGNANIAFAPSNLAAPEEES